MKTVHIQEFRAMVDRATRIIASTHSGSVNISKEEAIEWAERQTREHNVGYSEEPPCFIDLPPCCLLVASRKDFAGSVQIAKQRRVE